MKAVLIKGSFTDDQLREILDVVRRAERTNPDDTYHVLLLDPEAVDTGSVDAMHRLLELFPRLEGGEIDILYKRMPTTDLPDDPRFRDYP